MSYLLGDWSCQGQVPVGKGPDMRVRGRYHAQWRLVPTPRTLVLVTKVL